MRRAGLDLGRSGAILSRGYERGEILTVRGFRLDMPGAGPLGPLISRGELLEHGMEPLVLALAHNVLFKGVKVLSHELKAGSAENLAAEGE
jgi:hypothetical protein